MTTPRKPDDVTTPSHIKLKEHRTTVESFSETVARHVGYALAARCDRGELARVLRDQAAQIEGGEATG